jgi:hypothetical protein
MFLESVKEDLRIMFFLVGLSFLISLVIFVVSKKKFLSLLLFSILANASIYSAVLVESAIFRIYDLYWLRDFSRFYWPIINLILLAILIINWSKNGKTKK